MDEELLSDSKNQSNKKHEPDDDEDGEPDGLNENNGSKLNSRQNSKDNFRANAKMFNDQLKHVLRDRDYYA